MRVKPEKTNENATTQLAKKVLGRSFSVMRIYYMYDRSARGDAPMRITGMQTGRLGNFFLADRSKFIG